MADQVIFGNCDSCLTRRDFLGRVALVAGAVIAAGCSVSDLTSVGTGPIPGGNITFKSTTYAGLATAGQPVEVKTSTGAASGIAVVRTSATTFLALSMACTHEGTRVTRLVSEPACPVDVLARVTAAGFGQRRKMLRTSLKTLTPFAALLLQRTGIASDRRAETLTVAEFARLAAAFESAPAAEAEPSAGPQASPV